MMNKQTTVDEKSLLNMIDLLRMDQDSRVVSQFAEDYRNQVEELIEKYCAEKSEQNDFNNTVDDVVNATYDDGFSEGFRVGVQLFRTLMAL